jgi:hypothetical protein
MEVQRIFCEVGTELLLLVLTQHFLLAEVCIALLSRVSLLSPILSMWPSIFLNGFTETVTFWGEERRQMNG